MSLTLLSVSTEAIGQGRSAQIQNLNTPGNLESNYNLGCIALKDVKSLYSPVDLFTAVKACVIADRYDDAVQLFMIAGTYGRYDALRVSDPTSHQALTVARMEILGDLPDADSEKFKQAASTLLDDTSRKSELCVEVERVGPPSYFPRYMIQHGMGAFFGGSGNGLVKNFDAKLGWSEAVSTYLHCGVSS